MANSVESGAGEPVHPPHRGERRASVRIAVHARAAVSTDSTPQAPWHPAIIKDLSNEGLGLIADRCFPVETVLYVRQPESTNPPFIAEVVHTREERAGWFHGCKIVWTEVPWKRR